MAKYTLYPARKEDGNLKQVQPIDRLRKLLKRQKINFKLEIRPGNEWVITFNEDLTRAGIGGKKL